MDENANPGDKKLDQSVLFRYQLVSRVLSYEHGGWVRPTAVKAVAGEDHLDGNGAVKRVSVRTLYRWIAAYEAQGIGGLCRGSSQVRRHVIPEKVAAFLVSEKEADPRASIPELIRRAKEEDYEGAEHLERTTVWRYFRALGVSTRRKKVAAKGAMRRFCFAHRMEMVLCDGKHFRAGPNRTKRVVLFYLDDATRLVLGAVVGSSENHHLFLRGLYRCIHRYGLMQCLFTDNGSGFIADDSKAVLAQLGVHYIQGSPGYPQGRGKVERFNRTAFEDHLRHLDRSELVDPDCAALELRINHYLDQIYNPRGHNALDGMSPKTRFGADIKPLRFKDPDKLADHFRLPVNRLVSKDQIISVDGVEYAMPTGYARQRVELSRDLLGQQLQFIHEGRRITLYPNDPHQQARRPRHGGRPQTPEPIPTATRGSAEMRFNQNFQPLVDDEGNFYDPKESDHDPIP